MGKYRNFQFRYDNQDFFLSPQEEFILEQVEKGQEADLEKEFGPEEDRRRVRAGFLEALLTAGFQKPFEFQVHRRGIFFLRAVIAEPLDLENAEIASAVGLIGCVFKDRVNFRNSHCQRNLLLNDTEFRSRAVFHLMKAAGGFWCRRAIFYEGADFRYTEILGQFMAAGAKFLHAAEKSNFNGLKVGQSLSLREAEFHGPADFGGADIARDLIADGARFYHPEKESTFHGVKVGQTISFQGTTFQGPVLLDNAQCMDLLIGDTEISSLNLERTRVDRKLGIEKTVFGQLQASNMQIKGPAIFLGMRVTGKADLRDTNFQNLYLLEYAPPADPHRPLLLLDGSTFQSITTKIDDNEPEDWAEVLRILELSRFNNQNYSQVEEFLHKGGNQKWANEVYIAMRRRERRLLEPYSLNRLGNWFLDVTMGFGRKLRRLLYISIITVLLGTCIFWNQDRVEQTKTRSEVAMTQSSEDSAGMIKPVRQRFDPFLYSLDLFIPVSLDVAAHWDPRHDYTLGWYYAKFEMAMGWIVMTLLFLARARFIR